MSWKCPECGLYYLRASQLIAHLRDKHDIKDVEVKNDKGTTVIKSIPPRR